MKSLNTPQGGVKWMPPHHINSLDYDRMETSAVCRKEIEHERNRGGRNLGKLLVLQILLLKRLKKNLIKKVTQPYPNWNPKLTQNFKLGKFSQSTPGTRTVPVSESMFGSIHFIN